MLDWFTKYFSTKYFLLKIGFNFYLNEGKKVCLKLFFFSLTLSLFPGFLKAEPTLENAWLNTEKQFPNSDQIEGFVTDSITGEPLAGVTVRASVSGAGTLTNSEGYFSLEIESDDRLVISFLGYENREIEVNGQNNLDIRLVSSSTGLNELVVVGYGTQKKKDLTGSVSSLNGDDVENLPVQSPIQAMQGKIAGVQVTQSSGSPGSAGVVHIRGIGSINGSNNPLYIVDGLPQNDISWLSPNDIKTMDVLKDASAAAIYGARASNGVVLVTTKGGEKDQPLQVSFNMYLGFQSPWKRPYSLNAKEFIEYKIRALEAAGEPLPNELSSEENISRVLDFVEDNTGSKNGTDWWKQITDYGALIQNYDLGVSGGSEKATYSSTIGYLKQDGIIQGTGYSRISWKNNFGVDIGSRIKVNTRFALNYEQRNTTGEQNPWSGMVFLAEAVDPITPVYRDNLINVPSFYSHIMDGYQPNNPFSMFAGPIYNNKYNPVGRILRDRQNKWEGLSIKGGTDIQVKILNPLNFKTSVFVDLNRNISRGFTPEYHLNAFDLSNLSAVSNGLDRSNYYVWENTLNFDQNWGDHHLQGLIGTAAELTEAYSFAASIQDLPDNSVGMRIIDAGKQNPGASGSKYSTSLQSFFGRVNYSYKDKYIITGNVRRDGSSNFGRGHKWGTFPSVAIAWRLSNEDFMQGTNNWLSDAKIRSSYGEIGNQNVTSGAYLTTFGNSSRFAFGNPNSIFLGRGRTTVGNPALEWETSKEFDLGLDLSILNEKLSITIDYFKKKVSDMLLQVPLPSTLGFPNFPWVNAGNMENKGWEFSLTYNNNWGDFNYSIVGNISSYKNKVTSLGGGGAILTPAHLGEDLTITNVGGPVGAFYGWIANGLFQNEEDVDKSAQKDQSKPGDIRFVDLNEDGKINSEDRTMIGNPWPDFTYGLTLNGQYHSFDISLFFQGSKGNDVLNILRYDIEGGTSNYNAPKGYLEKAWNGSGTSNDTYKISADAGLNQNSSSYFIEKGSYLRLKNIQVGYNLPARLLERWNIPQLRFYVSAQNLFTITDYSGLDPEIGSTANGEGNLIVGDPKLQGVDQGAYPHPRIFTFGINARF